MDLHGTHGTTGLPGWALSAMSLGAMVACSSGGGTPTGGGGSGSSSGNASSSSSGEGSAGGSGSASGASSGSAGSGSGSEAGEAIDGASASPDGGIALCYIASGPQTGCGIAGAEAGYSGAAAAQLCTEAGGTVVSTCPTAGLIGCCKFSGAIAQSTGSEACQYTASGMSVSDFMQTCGPDGTFSTMP